MSANSTPIKTFRYKVYNSAGVYQGDLKNVESLPDYTWNINDAGPQLVITIDKPADSFSEGTLVAFRNKVQIYCSDAEAPTGTLIFQGFISSWTPIYQAGAEKVQITVLSYGYELSQIYLQNYLSQLTYNNTLILGGGFPTASNKQAQLIQIGPGQSQITGMDLYLSNPSGGLIDFDFYQQSTGSPNTPDAGTLLSAGNQSRPASGFSSPILTHIDLSSVPVTVTPGSKVWIIAQQSGANPDCLLGYDSTGNPYNGGRIATWSGGVWGAVDATKAWYFVVYPNNQTQISFSNVDVGTAVQRALDNYALQGGTLTYDSSSVPLVGSSISYTFNQTNVFDFLNKMKDLAPPNYFWYVDITTNKVYFQQKGNSAARKFTLGKDLLEIQLQKYMENIVNTLFFTGGATAGVNLFRQYVKSDSVALYGVRSATYNDSNVTGSANADAIAASYFAFNAAPQIRSTVDIVDSAAGGFDIEVIRPGDMCSFKGFKGSASSLWDVGQWDVDYWDFNINDVNSFVLQITRLHFTPSVMTIDVSMIPPQITAQTQALQAALQQQIDINNPSTPTTVYL